MKTNSPIFKKWGYFVVVVLVTIFIFAALFPAVMKALTSAKMSAEIRQGRIIWGAIVQYQIQQTSTGDLQKKIASIQDLVDAGFLDPNFLPNPKDERGKISFYPENMEDSAPNDAIVVKIQYEAGQNRSSIFHIPQQKQTILILKSGEVRLEKYPPLDL